MSLLLPSHNCVAFALSKELLLLQLNNLSTVCSSIVPTVALLLLLLCDAHPVVCCCCASLTTASARILSAFCSFHLIVPTLPSPSNYCINIWYHPVVAFYHSMAWFCIVAAILRFSYCCIRVFLATDLSFLLYLLLVRFAKPAVTCTL